MLANCLEQEVVRKIVEQALYIKLQNPIIFPAPLSRDPNGVQRRFPRPVAIGVCQEYLVQIRLYELFDNHLSNSIRYSWHGCVELHLGPANLWDLRR